MPMPRTAAEDDLGRRLRALPDPLPPATLEHRLRASHASRALRLRSGAGLLAAGVLAVVLLPPMFPAPGPSTAVAPAATGIPVEIPADRQLQAIDRALQAAYARGASDDEVAPLWHARQKLTAAMPPSPARNPS